MDATEEIFEEIVAAYEALPLGEKINKEAGCLFWGLSTVKVMRAKGVRCLLQAGTAMWPTRANWADESVPGDTHFSYVFDAVECLPRFSAGMLPELHVWACLPDHRILIDMTTGFQPHQLKLMRGQEWDPNYLPPPRLWCSFDAMPPGWLYKPDKQAIVMAMAFATMWSNGRCR